jgi:hypothetical protein
VCTTLYNIQIIYFDQYENFKILFFLQSIFNISFRSHHIVLFGINTSDDSDGSNVKNPISLTNQFTNLEVTVVRNVTPRGLLDEYLSVIFMPIAAKLYSKKFSFNYFFKCIVNETVTS